jgi:hypothetical protein
MRDVEPDTFEESEPVPAATVTLVEGASFAIGGSGGDFERGGVEGLVVGDRRICSRMVLSIDGLAVEPLSVAVRSPSSATFVGRTADRRLRRSCGPTSNGTSGSRSRRRSRSPSTVTSDRSTRSRRTWGTACGRGSSATGTRRRRSLGGSSRRSSSVGGGSGRSRRRWVGTARSATTTGRCGRTTRRSAWRGSVATASSTRPIGLRWGCSPPPTRWAGACRSSSRVSRPRRCRCRSGTPRRAPRRRGHPRPHSC